MKETKLVRAGVLVTGFDQQAVFDGAVAVSGDRIEAVGSYEELSRSYIHAKTIGGKQFLLIPGLINGHGHGRGVTDFQHGNLDNTLESWIFDSKTSVSVNTFEDVAYSAIRLLKSGVTTTMHNYNHFNDVTAYKGEFEEVLRAYQNVGMRVQFNPGIRNANLFVYGDNETFLRQLPKEMRSFLTNPPPPGSFSGDNFVPAVKDLYQKWNGPMSKIGFGPLAPQWCTEELLLQVKQEAEKLQVPVHVHALQTIFQKIYGLEYLGKTLIQYMDDIGMLGPRLVIGHCVWPTEKDIELLVRTRTGVTHHPACNLRVRNGIAPAFHMLQAGVRVGLGLDGKSINDDDDMIQEMKVCYLLHRIPSLELDSPHMGARQVFRMATETNASLLGYEGEIGRIAPGMKADLVLLDYENMCSPYVDPAHDPIDVLLYRGLGSHVDTVMINGQVVMDQREVRTIDEDRLKSDLAKMASYPRTAEEANKKQLIAELKKYIVSYYKEWPARIKTNPYFQINSKVDS